VNVVTRKHRELALCGYWARPDYREIHCGAAYVESGDTRAIDPRVIRQAQALADIEAAGGTKATGCLLCDLTQRCGGHDEHCTLRNVESTRWVPVGEGLPLLGKHVLVTFVDEFPSRALTAYHDGSKWCLLLTQGIGTGPRVDQGVTHWMPLPEALPQPPAIKVVAPVLTGEQARILFDGLYEPNFPTHSCKHCGCRAPKWDHKSDCAWVQARAYVDKARELVHLLSTPQSRKPPHESPVARASDGEAEREQQWVPWAGSMVLFDSDEPQQVLELAFDCGTIKLSSGIWVAISKCVPAPIQSSEKGATP
jgi:hypothetical protein